MYGRRDFSGKKINFKDEYLPICKRLLSIYFRRMYIFYCIFIHSSFCCVSLVAVIDEDKEVRDIYIMLLFLQKPVQLWCNI